MVWLRRRLRAARPSLRVGRLRRPATGGPDGWSPPSRLARRNRIRLTGQLVRPPLTSGLNAGFVGVILDGVRVGVTVVHNLDVLICFGLMLVGFVLARAD
jgi:hypothetical protein